MDDIYGIQSELEHLYAYFFLNPLPQKEAYEVIKKIGFLWSLIAYKMKE